MVWLLDAGTGDTIGHRSLDVRRGETDEPHGVAVSPDRRFWYATVSHGTPSLWKFDATDHRLVGRLDLPTFGASRVGIDPSGRWAWVPDYWRSGQGQVSRVARVDLIDLQLTHSPEVCPAPHDAQVDPTGALVAVTCALSDEVVLLDTRTAEVVARTPLEGRTVSPGSPRLRPMNVVWAPDGARLYVTLMGAGFVATLDREGRERARVAAGQQPAQLAATPDGRRLVVANRGDMSISVFDVDPSGVLGSSVAVPLPEADHPHGVALNEAGSIAFVSFEGTTSTPGGVVAVELDSGTVLWRSNVGVYTLGVAWMPTPSSDTGGAH